MKNHVYYNPTRIYFGKDAESNVPAAVAEYGVKRVLLHYGSDRVVKNGLLPLIQKGLEQEGILVERLGGVDPNPKAELVYKGIELCRKEHVEFIVAIGGGSVIDSAKAIAAGSRYEGDFWDFYIGRAAPVEIIISWAALNGSCGGTRGNNRNSFSP